MAYKHGVYTSEIPTSIIPAVNTTAGLPVVFGIAPIHLAKNRATVNKPILCHSYQEAVEQFGYSKDWHSYTLCEVMYSQFALYNRGPVVFVNVLDSKKHKESVQNKELSIKNKIATINEPILTETLKVKKASAGENLKLGVDYDFAYDDNEILNIMVLDEGQLQEATNLFIDYDKITPNTVNSDDVIGGVDITTGAYKGLETLNQVFPLYGLVPGIVLAPGFSDKSDVAAVMKAKASNINSHFKAITLHDAPTNTLTKYTDVNKWKNDNSFNGENQILCWPMVKLGDDIYHMSTHVLGVIATTDSNNDDIPYESPSNKPMQIDGICLENNQEVILGPDEANYLEGEGIVTSLNFIGGWKLWGNRTCCYPSNTDPKDSFICIRRMFNWHAQTFIQTYWSKVDKPINKRLIETVIDSENIRINGFVSEGILLGGRIEFQENENDTTNLLDGIIKFHTYFTPPTPAREIDNVIEYDPTYFSNLFN